MVRVLVLAAVMAVAPVDQAGRPQPRDPVGKSAEAVRTATISGRVTDAESGRPLRDAEVVAFPWLFQGPPGLPRSFRTATDHDGRYSMTGLPPGEYTINANPGAMRASHLTISYGAASRDGADGMRPLAVQAGDVMTGIDIALPRAYAIAGRVINEMGQPMADVGIRVERLGRPWGSGRVSPSDDRGMFRVFGLPPGSYRICAEAQAFDIPTEQVGGVDLRYVKSCHPLPGVDASPVVISKADVHGVEIRMRRGSAWTISGEVADLTGEPVVDASVDVSRDDGSSRVGTTAEVVGSRFVVRGVVDGEYRIRARRGSGGRAAPRGEITVRVDGSDVAGVEVRISPGATVRGRIELEGGSLSSGALRALGVSTSGPLRGRPASSDVAPVNDDLGFQLTGIFDPAMIDVQGLPERWAVKSVTYGASDITDRVTTFPLASPDTLKITLTNRTGRLRVRTLDGEGRQRPALFILVSADPERREGSSFAEPAGNALFDLGYLAPGDYLLVPISNDVIARSQGGVFDLTQLMQRARRVSLRAGDDLVIDLPVPAGEAK